MAIVESFEFGKEGTITATTLTASDVAVVNLSRKATLIINNVTAGALTVNIVGDTATTKVCAGIGEIDLTDGIDAAVGIGEVYRLPLNSERQYWLGDGNITITGGDGAEAYILEV